MMDIKVFDWGWMNLEEGSFHKQQIINEIFLQKVYEKFFEVEENDIVLDIGASHGPFTYSILHKKPKHVFCIEPSEVEFPILVKNTTGYPVTQINKGISNFNTTQVNDYVFGNVNTMEGITFSRLRMLYNLVKIDFLKIDCEGGEYFIFNENNLEFIKNNVKKITGEWHLSSPELKEKFKYFRDTILIKFDNYNVLSVDGVDIKWSLFNEDFIDYYTEILIYIDNR